MNWFWKLLGVGVVAYCVITLVNKVPASVFDPLTPANNALVQSQVYSTMADVGVKQSVAVVNNAEAQNKLAEANAKSAEAAKTWQEIRKWDEAVDGYAANAGARVLMGTGITDAEKLGTGVFSAMLCGLPLFGLLVAVLLWAFLSKFTRTTVTHV